MEAPANHDELTRWLDAQGEITRRRLARLPGREKLMKRALDLELSTASVSNLRRIGDRLFYLKAERGVELKRLFVRDSAGERLLVDPQTLASDSAQHFSIDNYTPSPDGTLVAYNLAGGGGEITRVHVIDVASGRERGDVIEHIWGEFPVIWLPDSKRFFYTQMAPEAFADPHVDKLQRMRAFMHRLGEPTSRDVPVLGIDISPRVHFEPQEFPSVELALGSRWLIGQGSGARNERRVFAARVSELDGARTPWVNIADYGDEIEGIAVHGDDLYLLSTKDAPNRRILRVALDHPRLANARVVISESDDVIESFAVDAHALYVVLTHNGRSRLHRLDLTSGRSEDLALPFEGWIDTLVTDERQSGVVVRMEGWTREPSYFDYDAKTRAFADLHVAERGGADFSAIVADEVEVRSADGVRVPLSILHRAGLSKDHNRPTELFGYGAYGISMTPQYRAVTLAWLERGGVLAVAHVRGGGEKGNAWRLAGKGANKPNSIADFIACGQALVRDGWTTPTRLAAYSASAGGILVGRALTERPDLFAAAMIYAGDDNALRYLEASNGANQKAEMGTPDSEAGFRALLAMDAYQHVKAGVAYPAVMLGTGLNDGRVAPWMSAKLAAQLGWATASHRPVLMRVEHDEGHGVGSTRQQRVAMMVDMWSFFLEQFDDPEFRALTR
jgi:prolyl oligopeptidase